MVEKNMVLKAKTGFIAERQGFPGYFSELSPEEKADLVNENPDYGEVVCRCEQITRKEVLDAVQNPLGSRTINGIKYRSRAMMGRCQGGFCFPKIVQILKKEFGYRVEDFILKSRESWMFSGQDR
jgi:glycerol-3-phosphate dehydrogenase